MFCRFTIGLSLTAVFAVAVLAQSAATTGAIRCERLRVDTTEAGAVRSGEGRHGSARRACIHAGGADGERVAADHAENAFYRPRARNVAIAPRDAGLARTIRRSQDDRRCGRSQRRKGSGYVRC